MTASRLALHVAGAILLTLLAVQVAFTQVEAPRSVEVAQPQVTQIYPMPGCERLWRAELEVQRYVNLHPELRTATQLAKKTDWNFNVGDTHAWWATNMVTNKEYSVPSTCRKVGPHAYYFVEDSLWQVERVKQAAVDSIEAAFDLRTPANPQKGIFDTHVETFGDPPNVDGDPRIIILILDIKDGYTGGSGSYTAGYFYSINEYPDGSIPNHRSNNAEIYYVDGYPTDLATSGGLQNAASTTAHEFQHLIHWAHDQAEITFINESCSEVASLVCGYPYPQQSLYTDAPDIYLLNWSGSLADYSRAARWSLYLWNQFPNDYLKLLVDNKGTATTGIDNALALYVPTTARRFNNAIFADWLVANYLNDASVNTRYAYTYSSTLTKAKGISYITPNVTSQSNAISRLGADYISFTSGQSLNVTFTSSSNLAVKAIETGPAGKRVLSVPLNAPMSEPAFGTSYSTVTFVVMNLSQSSDGSYGYQATGTGGGVVELKWDETEPTGYLSLSPLDTLCVTFDAVGGAMLDSVRVALRRTGVVRGAVWRYTGAPLPTPLGAPLAKPITASTSLTPSVVNPGGPYPYAVPYPNWRTIDLRSYNIRTDQPFVVGFWLESDTSNDARVMTTYYNSSDAYHSYAYLHNPSGGFASWYYLSAGESQIYLFLVRAYASVHDTNTQSPEPTVPFTMALHQNYPNPFNSTTKIRYAVSVSGLVRLRVFDLMGRLVSTLVDQDESTGDHEVEWDGCTISGTVAASGVYFYQLLSGGFQGTQKMILLR